MSCLTKVVLTSVAVLLVAGAASAAVCDCIVDPATAGSAAGVSPAGPDAFSSQRDASGLSFMMAPTAPAWLIDEIWILPLGLVGGSSGEPRHVVSTIDDYSEARPREDADRAASDYVYGDDLRGYEEEWGAEEASLSRDRSRDWVSAADRSDDRADERGDDRF
jgi:hypothetical protein